MVSKIQYFRDKGYRFTPVIAPVALYVKQGGGAVTETRQSMRMWVMFGPGQVHSYWSERAQRNVQDSKQGKY